MDLFDSGKSQVVNEQSNMASIELLFTIVQADLLFTLKIGNHGSDNTLANKSDNIFQVEATTAI